MTQTEAFLWTLAIEVPIVVALGLGLVGRGARPSDALRLGAAAVLASSFTHPLLWLVDPLLQDTLDTPVRWALLESEVCLAEAIVYRVVAGLSAPRALLASFLSNGASFGYGIWLHAHAG